MSKKIIALCTLILVVLLSSLCSAQDYSSEKNPFTEEILKLLNPSDLGIAELRESNVNINKVGAEAVYRQSTTKMSLYNAIKILKDKKGHGIVANFAKSVANNSFHGLNATRYLEVYEITPVYENVNIKAYVTVEVVEITANEDYKELDVLMIMSKYVTQNSSDLLFIGKRPAVFKQEPLLILWDFKDIAKDETINVTFLTKNLVIGDEDSMFIVVADPLQDYIINADDLEVKNFLQGRSIFGSDLRRVIGTKRLNFANLLLIISIVAVLLFFGGIVLLELDGRHAFESIKNVCRDLECVARIGKRNKQIMESYICECLDHGHDIEDIRISLIRAGWNEHAIENLVNKYK